LSLIGGNTAEKNLRKVLRRVFGTELSKRVNFTGKGGKLALKHLNILGVMKGI
jgi:hypothetical protein